MNHCDAAYDWMCQAMTQASVCAGMCRAFGSSFSREPLSYLFSFHVSTVAELMMSRGTDGSCCHLTDGIRTPLRGWIYRPFSKTAQTLPLGPVCFRSITTGFCYCGWRATGVSATGACHCLSVKNCNGPLCVYHLICLCKTRCPLVAWQMNTVSEQAACLCVRRKESTEVWWSNARDALSHRRTWLAFHRVNHFITPQRKKKKKKDECPLIC